MSTEQGRSRPWNQTRYVDVLPGHDLTLTRSDVEGAPVGAVFGIAAEFGPDGWVPISVERRRNGTWTVHSRAYVPSEALIGAKATPRRRVSRMTGEDAPPAEQTSDQGGTLLASAVAVMARAPR